MKYVADGWVILKFTMPDEKIYYRIFASWRGGYLDGDSWKLSSGSESLPKLSECKKYWIWPQMSGSCYELPIKQEGGYSTYTGTVLASIINKSGTDGTSIEEVKLNEIIGYSVL